LEYDATGESGGCKMYTFDFDGHEMGKKRPKVHGEKKTQFEKKRGEREEETMGVLSKREKISRPSQNSGKQPNETT